MYLRKTITLQVDSCHNLDPPSYDLHKLSDTQAIDVLLCSESYKIVGLTFSKLNIKKITIIIVC